MEVLIEYGKILLPAAIVLYAMYLMVRSFIIKEIEQMGADQASGSSQDRGPH